MPCARNGTGWHAIVADNGTVAEAGYSYPVITRRSKAGLVISTGTGSSAGLSVNRNCRVRYVRYAGKRVDG
jgi:hypothetical protein